jgi:general stress protein 26
MCHRDQATNPDEVRTAFFYCARDPAEAWRADPREIMSCILEQLSSSKGEIPALVHQRYKEKVTEAKECEPERLRLDEIIDAMLDLLKTNPATIIIDALDECDPQSRQSLFHALRSILAKSGGVVKIFVSSRDDNDVVNQFTSYPNIYITTQDNSKDIEDFIHVQVTAAIKEQRLLCGNVSANLEQHIIKSLIKQAQGM